MYLFRRILDSFWEIQFIFLACIICTPDGLMELNTVPGKCCCPWVNEWQFTTVVVAAVEPYDLCDHVQMQENGGNKWISGERIALRSPPQWSQLNPLATEHCSVTDADCYWNMPSVILVASACELEMCAVTFSHTTTVSHIFIQLFQTVIAMKSVCIAWAQMWSTMQTQLPFLRISEKC